MSFKLVPFESLGAVSYSPSIVTMALSGISSEIKPDIGRKSRFFHTPFALLAVWLSGNALVSINVVTLRWARLVPGWVTVYRQVNYLSM